MSKASEPGKELHHIKLQNLGWNQTMHNYLDYSRL